MLKNIENQADTLTPGNKRSADLMLQQAVASPGPMASPSAETVNSDTQSDTENYSLKRPRVGDVSHSEKITPSKVIHIRNLPQDTSETEIMMLAAPFGHVTNMILMRNKRQAFVEMGELSQSVELVKKHQNPIHPAIIRGQTVQVQYSATYTELKPGQRSHANGMIPTPVLHINIDNLLFPVSLAVLQQIFSKFGIVEKIITFSKNNQFQSLVQMSDVLSAQTAKQALDGKNIFPNCCMLRIDFSKMLSVNVRYNNDKSRDFTNPNLPSGDDVLPVPPTNALPAPKVPPIQNKPQTASPVSVNQLQALGLIPYTTVTQPSTIVNPMNPLATLNSVGGYRMMATAGVNQMLTGIPGIPSQQMPTSASSAIPAQLTQQSSNPLALQGLGANQLQSLQAQYALANQLQAQRLVNQQQAQQLVTANQIQSQQIAANQYVQYVSSHANGAHSVMSSSLQNGGNTSPSTNGTSSPSSQNPALQSNPVVLVSNLNSKIVNPEALFTLFGMYGDVMKVKILYNKQDTAMVQFCNASQAQLACKYLDKAVFWDHEIRVTLSKHMNIQLPSDAHLDNNKLTRDFTNSPLHRYKKKGSKNLSNIFPPSSTLHLSNIPTDVSEETLAFTEFSRFGTVTGFRFFEKDRSMAFIQMSTVSEAIEALIGMHNFPLSNHHHLRVSFTKATI